MLIDSIHDAQKKDEKLVLVVGRPGSGKSKIMRSLADMRSWKYIDAAQLVTDELLELVPRVRAREAPAIMGKVLGSLSSEVYLIDDLQLLFTPLLQLDPYSLLKQLSRKHTIVASWPGTFENGELCFAYNRGFVNSKRQYTVEGVTVIQL
jgi:energy-coupling factor transporter ATP-binding protein EcfA2